MVSLLVYLSWTTIPYLRWAALSTLMRMDALSVMEKPSEITGLSVIVSSILYLFSKVNHAVNRLVNRFATKSKFIVNQRPAEYFLTLFINSFWSSRKKPLVIWLTVSHSRKTQHKFYIIRNSQVICEKSHPSSPLHLCSYFIRWYHPTDWLFLPLPSKPKIFA